MPPRYGASAALACSFLLATVVLVWYYRRLTDRTERFMTVTGRGYQPRTWELGRWQWPVAGALWVLLAVVWILPVVVMVLVSVQPVWTGSLQVLDVTLTHYVDAVLDANLREAFVNSVLVSVAAASIGTALSVGVAYYTERTDGRFRGAVDFLSLTPIAVPGIIIGVSLLFTALWVGQLHSAVNLYGSLWLIVVGIVVVFIPVSSRIAIGNIVQIHAELEESARIFGASWVAQMREIFLPLFRNTTAVIWFFLLVHTFQVITVPIMTYAPDTRIVPVELFNIYLNSANIELVAAISTLFVAFFAVVIVAMRVAGIRFYALDGR